jgi:CIC family chloride channel protein
MATGTQAWRQVTRNAQLLLLLLALVVGIAAGYGALPFRLLTAAIQVLFLGHGTEHLVSAAAMLPWWQVLLAPTVGGLFLGLLMRLCCPGGCRRAWPTSWKRALSDQAAWRWARICAAFVSAASIGCGASVGREGPIVHLGATFGSYAARRLHLSPQVAQTLLGCGVAAAIASAFKAPIAGVFFALEVVVGHYGPGAFSPVVISSVIAR